MYNGVEAAQVKGTGLSGYVQRSKATVNAHISKFRPADVLDSEEVPTDTINPLLAKRSQRENDDMVRRLEVHKAIRAVKLKVLLYREERVSKGVGTETVERECKELYDSLMEVAMEEQRERKKAVDEKSAARFAAAFGVKETASGRAFDRAQLEEEKRGEDEERRRVLEHQLAERVKRARQDHTEN